MVNAISWRNVIPSEEGLNAFYGYPEPTVVGQGYMASAKVSPKPRPIEEWVAELKEAGIIAVISAIDNEIPHGKGRVVNPQTVAELCQTYPEQFIGFAGVNPFKGMAGVRELERQVREYGFKGVDIQPMQNGIPINDPRYYPIYAKAAELDIVAFIAVSVHYNLTVPIDVQHPLHLDRVCSHFPELKVVARHAGWPWIEELVAVAFRHGNVYLETSGFRPRYLKPNLLEYMNGALKDRTVYGGAGGVGGLREGDMVAEFQALPLKEEVKRKILVENSAKLLGLGL